MLVKKKKINIYGMNCMAVKEIQKIIIATYLIKMGVYFYYSIHLY